MVISPLETVNKRLTVCVCTYNSFHTLEACLKSIRRILPDARLILMDHVSLDRTIEIARTFGAEIYSESVGLGYARQRCFELVKTDYLAFVDSDVEITDSNFFEYALLKLKDPEVGAIVGMSHEASLPYGLPAGLLVLRRDDFQGRVIPSAIDARETYYIQSHLDELGLKTSYLPNAMIHRSEYRQYKPEWEGANTRIACGLSMRELLYAVKVILLMTLNSHSARNSIYVPVFVLKFMKGFVEPERWRHLERPVGSLIS